MRKYLFGFFAVLFALPAFGAIDIDAEIDFFSQICNIASGSSINCNRVTSGGNVNIDNSISCAGGFKSSVTAEQRAEMIRNYCEKTLNENSSELNSAAATMTISGRIVDENGEPLIGATIVPSGESTGIGTTSDMDGNFTLDNFPSDRDVQISYIGFKDQTLTPGQNMNITLTEDAELLDEIVVEEQWKSRDCTGEELAAINATSGHTARNADGNGVYCVPDDCAYGYRLNKKANTCDALNCESPRYILNAAGDKCEDQVGKKCTASDANASKSEYVWENNTLKCEIKKCNKGYLPNDAGTACDVSEGPCTDAQIQQIEHATAGELKRGVCHATECDAGYEVSGGKCIAISGNCSPMPENATSAHREYDSTAGVEVCIIDACRDGYSISNDKKSCIEPTLSQEDAQKQIAELQENADAMKEREQSLANRLIGGAGIGAMGIGGMQVASALAEQNADADAERDMAAYLATFKCDYGQGMTISGGETNIQLPGANVLLPIYNEYTTLAADLKTRKEALGMTPGIESEVILDAATSGLYDNAATGITDGAYTSLSRALSDPTGADAAEWAAQKSDTSSQLKTGAIVAGAGAVVGIVGDVLTNYVGDKPRESSDEILAKYEPLKKLRDNTAKLPDAESTAKCPSDATGTYPDCVCTNTKYIHNANTNMCESCPGDKVSVNNTCDCPNGTLPGENNTCVTPTAPTVTAKCDTSAGHVTVDPKTGDCECTDGYILSNDATPKCHCPTATHEINAQGQCVTKQTIPAVTEIVQPVVEIPTITLNTGNLFELNSSNLTSDAQNVLNTFVTDVKAQVGNNTDYCITVTGHTDKSGTDAINQPLSERRANAVKNALVSGGLSASNITASGVGSTQCNSTSKYDKNCRKVEVQFSNNKCAS